MECQDKRLPGSARTANLIGSMSVRFRGRLSYNIRKRESDWGKMSDVHRHMCIKHTHAHRLWSLTPTKGGRQLMWAFPSTFHRLFELCLPSRQKENWREPTNQQVSFSVSPSLGLPASHYRLLKLAYRETNLSFECVILFYFCRFCRVVCSHDSRSDSGHFHPLKNSFRKFLLEPFSSSIAFIWVIEFCRFETIIPRAEHVYLTFKTDFLYSDVLCFTWGFQKFGSIFFNWWITLCRLPSSHWKTLGSFQFEAVTDWGTANIQGPASVWT